MSISNDVLSDRNGTNALLISDSFLLWYARKWIKTRDSIQKYVNFEQFLHFWVPLSYEQTGAKNGLDIILTLHVSPYFRCWKRLTKVAGFFHVQLHTKCAVPSQFVQRGSYRGIFVMRDQIILFIEKRDFKKTFFVILDASIPRDTWRAFKWNLNIRHRTKKRICIKFALCKYVANMSFAPSARVVMAEFARFCANSAIATFALVAKLCEFHICNIFAPGKFGANSIFRPVRDSWCVNFSAREPWRDPPPPLVRPSSILKYVYIYCKKQN